MEVLNKMLYSQNAVKARDIMLSASASLNHAGSSPSTSPTVLPNLYPELGTTSALSLLTSNAWSQLLMSQSATAAWLQQQRNLLGVSPAQQQQQQHMNMLFGTGSHPHPLLHSPSGQRALTAEVEYSDISGKKKVSFSIDNIMNGKYEESRKTRQYLEQPSSPASSSTSSSTLSETNISGLKYECEVCSKTYSTFSGFTKHKQFYCTPQSKKQFNCKHCEKTYFSLGALKMHIRTHTLPCKCKACGKAFSRPWLLQGHMRTHTGEKPFKCQHCGRAFADRSNLRAHLQTHSDIKKYSCKQCDKTFSRMSLLLKHEESSCLSSSNIISAVGVF